MSKVDEALKFAVAAHDGTYRISLDIPYIIHPLEVLKQIKIWKIDDEDMEAATLLHDVVEDCGISEKEIESKFGIVVAKLVDELTYIGGVAGKQAYMDSFPNKSWQAHTIKIADRLCNVRDFILTDRKYALKYLLKAEYLINSFGKRDDVDRKLERVVHNDTSVLLGYLNGN